MGERKYINVDTQPGDIVYVLPARDPIVLFVNNVNHDWLAGIAYPERKAMAARFRAVADLIDAQAEAELQHPRLRLPGELPEMFGGRGFGVPAPGGGV